MGTKRLWWLVSAAAVVPLALILIWIWVLAQRDSPGSSLAGAMPWPVVCSSRGCITTTAWARHMQARTIFAQANDQSVPSSIEALTTLIRQHMVKHSFLRVPVTRQDAVRYREEILNALDEEEVRSATGLSLEDYDSFVILPLLQQEALRQERRTESYDELFTLLAQERNVIVLPWRLTWDKESAQVVEK